MQLTVLGVGLVTLLFAQESVAHVLLTYPPARYPQYDYLDNYRTGGPCGVPDDPNGPVTTLQAGSTFNISYYLSYPHKGGIRVSILNSTGYVIYALLGLQVPYVNSEDITLQQHEVVLPPDFVCERCVLHIIRQAIEFGRFGFTDFDFWSCADIAIVNSSSAVCSNMTCSGHGTCVDGECVCERLYSGEICQNKDECEDETDCSGHGSCVDIRATSYPTKQCYCNSGWFGDSCAQPSSLTDATINPNDYTLIRELHPKLMLYARIDGDELEVALKLNGTSFIGLGWKPTEGVVSTCTGQIPERTPVGMNPLWPHKFSFPMVAGADSFYNQLVGINSTYVPPDVNVDPNDPRDVALARLHPMDCTDIILGTARGEQYRVYDYYTRDRGQPWRDDFYNGEDSITAAVGKEEDGYTYIKWRRLLTTGDSAADYVIQNRDMVLIWAFGQVYPEYNHLSLTDAEFTVAQNVKFFPVDDLKYHGGMNRGTTTINFFSEDRGTEPTAGSATVTLSYITLLLSVLIAAQLLA